MTDRSHILLLGGTTEASALARALADLGMTATLSLAGRTERPAPLPLPTRIGGFGGVEGLAAYMEETGITHLVDATHPFAAQMSAHAVAAARKSGIPLIALTRPAWVPQPGDRWENLADIPSAVAALAGPARRIMLALGRMHVDAFAAQPQHHYLLRFVDRPAEAPVLPHHDLVVDRGPFTAAGDEQLMREHRIDLVIAKNAGGTGAEAKLIAARTLGLPMLMIDRPPLPDRREVHSVKAVLRWISHPADLGV